MSDPITIGRRGLIFVDRTKDHPIIPSPLIFSIPYFSETMLSKVESRGSMSARIVHAETISGRCRMVFKRIRGFIRSFASGTVRLLIPSRLESICSLGRLLTGRAYLDRKSDRQLHMMDTLIIESGRGPRWINSRCARSNPLRFLSPAKYPLSKSFN